jgi:nitrate reductase NapE component
MLNIGRTLVGGIVAGIILFVVGAIFWATPLHQLAFKTAPDQEGAAVQLALAQNLSRTGTGAYVIPYPNTQQGGALHSNGPIATVHFNTQGYSPNDMSALLPGFVFAIVAGLLMSLGLSVLGANRSFGERARLVVFLSVGFTLWTILARPVFSHFGWGYWFYQFITETTALILAGLVVVRWFLPHPHARTAPADAPAEV